jgi:diguanylate cyclase (GGDEF)-like protein
MVIEREKTPLEGESQPGASAAEPPFLVGPSGEMHRLVELADRLAGESSLEVEIVAQTCADLIQRFFGWSARLEVPASTGPGPAVTRPARFTSSSAELPVGGSEDLGAVLVIELPPGAPPSPAFRATVRLCAEVLDRVQLEWRARREEEEVRRLQSNCGELLESNRRLRELGQRKDDFLAICAKDLRAPLNVLLGQTRLLLNGTRGPMPESQRESLQAIERQGDRLQEIAQELLDVAALEASRLDIRREATDVVRLCSEVAGAYLPAARERKITLVRQLPSLALVLQLDSAKIREVLATLLSNAILFAPAGARIEFSLESGPDGVRLVIVVTDSSGEERAGSTASGGERLSVMAGWGAGITICRELVELHGGTLETEASPARGGRAVVSLPARLNPSDVFPGPRGGTTAGGARPRILIAEDENDIREALTALLEPFYTVGAVEDGQAAVEAARANPPDLILMDLFMPRMDGFAALESLRTEARTAEIPVIFVSARGDDVTKVKSLDLGAVDFLQKPFSDRELKARIERTLRLTRRQSQLRELAQTDALTGLANLRAFRSRLEEEVKRARRYSTPLTCVMADMDRLKPVNDQFGHAAGDRAIATVAEVIRGELRETDFGARYGGDEFVVLLPHTTAAEGKVFAERVCDRLRETALDVAGQTIPLVASFGVAELAPDSGDEGGPMLVSQADEALYGAKRGGRGHVEVYSPGAAPSPARAD